MTKDEALQLALKTLKEDRAWIETDAPTEIWGKNNEAIKAIKEALETKEGLLDRKSYLLGLYDQKSRVGQETKNDHVAWEQFHEHMAGPNYVAPQSTWVGLTKEEIDQGLLRSFYVLEKARAWRDGVAWAMQQLKDKNA